MSSNTSSDCTESDSFTESFCTLENSSEANTSHDSLLDMSIKSRGKKRKLNVNAHNGSKQKRRKNSGKSYLTRKGKKVIINFKNFI